MVNSIAEDQLAQLETECGAMPRVVVDGDYKLVGHADSEIEDKGCVMLKTRLHPSQQTFDVMPFFITTAGSGNLLGINYIKAKGMSIGVEQPEYVLYLDCIDQQKEEKGKWQIDAFALVLNESVSLTPDEHRIANCSVKNKAKPFTTKEKKGFFLYESEDRVPSSLAAKVKINGDDSIDVWLHNTSIEEVQFDQGHIAG
jgi:hypothetical protein